MFFQAVHRQAQDWASGRVPDLASYIDVRRDTSGCKPCFDLIEYALGIELPDYVLEHPVIMALCQETNDIVTWSNVCNFVTCGPDITHCVINRICTPIMSNSPEETPTTWSVSLWYTKASPCKLRLTGLVPYAGKPWTPLSLTWRACHLGVSK